MSANRTAALDKVLTEYNPNASAALVEASEPGRRFVLRWRMFNQADCAYSKEEHECGCGCGPVE